MFKTSKLIINFIKPKYKSSWVLIPYKFVSQVIYNFKEKMVVSPTFEFGWLFFIVSYTNYNIQKEYSGSYYEPEYEADLLQNRINELESAIKKHRNKVENDHPHIFSYVGNEELWKVLDITKK